MNISSMNSTLEHVEFAREETQESSSGKLIGEEEREEKKEIEKEENPEISFGLIKSKRSLVLLERMWRQGNLFWTGRR